MNQSYMPACSRAWTRLERCIGRECEEYYERYKPTLLEVNPKEDNIKFDQYTKALAHIGTVPDTQGWLMIVINQVRVFELNFLRVMEGLSRACEFYAKLLLNGVYEFLERLRTLETATEQVAQTFAEKQAEEDFHPQIKALLVTWVTNKVPEAVKTRAHNQRPQPSVRIILTEFYFTLLPQPGNKQDTWKILLEIQHQHLLVRWGHHQHTNVEIINPAL